MCGSVSSVRLRETVIDPADRPRTPWANGRGTTRLLGTAPDDAWRLSVADIVEDAEFSLFAGLDRVLVVVSGDVRLTIDGRTRALHSGDAASFAGESAVSASVEGPALVANLMVRRGAVTVEVSRPLLVEDVMPPAGDEIIVLLAAATTATGRALSPGTALLGRDAAPAAAEEARLTSPVAAVRFVLGRAGRHPHPER